MGSKLKRVSATLLALILALSTLFSVSIVSTSALTYNGSSSYKSGKYYRALTKVQLTGNQRTDIVNVANSQIGYQESSSSSKLSGEVRGSGNKTEYGRWYGLQDMWCAMFVSWCANTAGVSTSIVPKHCFTPSGLSWFKSRGLAYKRSTVANGGYKPQPGDIIYFKSSRNTNTTNHIGIVTKYSGKTVYTVEGNTSSATISTNGGAVAAKSYSISNTYIVYICKPKYKNTSTSSSVDTSATTPVVSTGSANFKSQPVDVGTNFYSTIENVNARLNLSIYNGKEVIDFTKSDSDAQQWKFIRQSNGSYKIQNKKYGTYLTVDGNGVTGDYIQIEANTNSADQNWYIYKEGNSFALRSGLSSTCALGAKNSSKATEAKIVISTYSSAASQKFNIANAKVVEPVTQATEPTEATTVPVGNDGVYPGYPVNIGTNFYSAITNVNANLNLSIYDQKDVIIYTKGTSDAQKWKFVLQSDGSYEITNKKYAKCINATGTSANSGVTIATDNNAKAQRWFVYKSGSNFVLRPATSKTLSLRAKGGAKKAETKIVVDTHNGYSSQLFKIPGAKVAGLSVQPTTEPSEETITTTVTKTERTTGYFNTYDTIDKITPSTSHTSMQALGVGSTYLYSVKIKGDNSQARIYKTNKNTGATTLLTNSATGNTYNTYLNHANDMCLKSYNGKTNLFIVTMKSGSRALVRVEVDGSKYKKVGEYYISNGGSNTSMSGVSILSSDSSNITFLFKKGTTFYKGTLPTNATSGTISTTKAFKINTSSVVVNGKATNLSSYTHQGFGLYKNTIFVPLTSSNKSVMAVYEIGNATSSDTLKSNSDLSFRITSSTYKVFEMESCGISSDGKLYFNTNRANASNGAQADGVHVICNYVYSKTVTETVTQVVTKPVEPTTVAPTVPATTVPKPTTEADVNAAKGAVDVGTDFSAKINNANAGMNLSLLGTDVIIMPDSDKPAQVWKFERQEDLSYKLTNSKTGQVLTVEGAKKTAGGNVIIADDRANDNQRWFVYKTSNGYALRPVHAFDLAIKVKDNGKTAQTHIQTCSYSGGVGETFTFNKDITSTSTGTTTTGATKAQMAVIRKIIYAVETGGQVYGRQDYRDFTEAYTNSSAEHAITIGAGQWYATEAKTLLNNIRKADPALFKKLDTAGIASDLDNKDWSKYKISKSSKKAKCIQNIIGSSVGIKCQDELIEDQMSSYMEYAASLGVTDIDAQMMCANIRHQGGTGALKRVLGKTKKPYTLDNIYNAMKTDTGNQVGAYKSRQKMVYNSLKKYI